MSQRSTKIARWVVGASLVFGLGALARAQPSSTIGARETPGAAQQGPDDGAQARSLEERLRADDMLKGARIRVTSRRGVATLNGSVPSTAARRRAAEIAGRSAGVRLVEDRLRVAPPRPMPVVPP